MEKTRGHVELIQQLEESRGGNGGDIFRLNNFMEFLNGMSDQEIAKLDAYADVLKGLTTSMLDKRGLKRAE